jgi:hypothetical protein
MLYGEIVEIRPNTPDSIYTGIKKHIQTISNTTTKPSLFFDINKVKQTSYKNDTTNSEIWIHFKENTYTIDMNNPEFAELLVKLTDAATTILSHYKTKKYIHVFVKVDDTSSSIHKLNGILLSDAIYGGQPIPADSERREWQP